MCPGIAVKGGGGGNGDGDGNGNGGNEDANGNGNGNGEGASGEDGAGGCAEGDPICPITGRMLLKIFDFGFGGPFPLRFLRSYSSRSANVNGEFGWGWSHTYGWRVRVRRQCVEVHDGDARRQVFDAVPPPGETIKNGLGWTLLAEAEGYTLRLPQQGLVYRFGRDAGGGWHHLASVTDNNGNTIRVERDPKGVLTGMIDAAGRPYRFHTDAEGRVLGAFVAADADQKDWIEVAAYTYDEAGNLASVTDAEGYTANYYYDRHLMVEHRSVTGLSYFYRYDGRTADAWCVESWGEYVDKPDPALLQRIPLKPAKGRDTRKVKGINHVRLTYLKSQRYTEVQNGLGGLTRYFGDELGRAVKIVDAAGGVKERVFDPETGAMLAEQDRAGGTRKVENDPRGVPIGHVGPDGKGFLSRLDDDGTEITVDTHHGAVIRRVRDARGNLVFAAYPDGTSEEWQIDDRGLTTREINRQGAVTKYDHDAMGNLVAVHHPDGGVERMEYDYLGRRTALVQPSGARTEWVWDRRSEVVLKRFPDKSEQRFAYDPMRKLIEVDDRGLVTRFEYGGVGWLTRIVRPGGATFDCRYDTEGNVVWVRNPRGQIFRIERDTAGRTVAFETFEGTRHTVGWDVTGLEKWVNGPAGRINFEHDDLQRLIAMATPDGDVTFEHAYDGIAKIDNGAVAVEIERDALGRVVVDKQGRHQNKVEWSAGELAAVTSDVGLPVSFAYDKGGTLSAIRAGSAAIETSQAAATSFLSTLGNGLRLRHGYDANGHLVSRCLARWSADVPDEAAATSADPNVIHWASYEYDPQERLRREWWSDGRTVEYDVGPDGHVTDKRTWRDGKVIAEERIAYDAAGTPRMSGARYDALGRPVALHGEAFEYDAAGRLSRRRTDAGEWTYTWNALDQLVRVEAPGHVVEMDYDAKGRRMKKRVLRQREVVSSTSYVWTNNVVLHEVDDLSGATRTYLRPNEQWSPLGHVDVRAGEEKATYYVLGPGEAVDFAVDASGAVVWDATTTVHGHAVPTIDEVDVTARLVNQFYDADVGLTYNRHRWYDARLGVYVSTDPFLLGGTWNPRDYVSNPFAYCDPLGAMAYPVGTGKSSKTHHPSPPDAKGSPPATSDDISPTGVGHWGTEGTKKDKSGNTIPGYAKCPNEALDHSSGKFGDPKDPTSAQAIVDKAGKNYGCHSCGARESGFKDPNHWCCDHVPPKSTYDKDGKQTKGNRKESHQSTDGKNSDAVRLYPHCKNCKNRQGGTMSHMSDADKAAAGKTAMAANKPPPPPPPPKPKGKGKSK
jgi:RHS repeat-associated protein